MSRGSASKAHWLRRIGLCVLILALLPAVEVGCVRVVDPPGTPLMLVRKIEAWSSGKTAAPIRYSWRSFSDVPPDFLRAVIASEDQRFLQHHGFDWQEISRARREAARSGGKPRGASTITMQCARSLFLWQGRSWIRKGLEAYLTMWMEALLPKRRILELYANVIELGDGIYGIEAAAQAHFSKPARQLSRDEAVLLAAILPSPRRWNPQHPDATVTLRSRRISREMGAVRLP